MKTLSIREMRASLGRLGDLVNREGELVITRNGKAIARVVPLAGRRPIPSRQELRSSMPELPSSADWIREDRDGR
ncbi:MAG: type II toxin-antitoxin system Phd/YefM family antitoxin [Holophagales bacterium]|nr:type II toxin-antitoxin system Phd/YefM family antitoxin [Holophagales bacterium]